MEPTSASSRRDVLRGAAAAAALSLGRGGPTARGQDAGGGPERRCEAPQFLQPADIPESARWAWELPVPGPAGVPDPDAPGEAGKHPMHWAEPVGYIRTADIRAQRTVPEDRRAITRVFGSPADARDGRNPVEVTPPIGRAAYGIAPEFWEKVGDFDPDDYWAMDANKVAIPFYEVTCRKVDAQLVPDLPADRGGTLVTRGLYGYGGQIPGPTFRVEVQRPVVVRFRNELTVETSVHLHGGHTPAHSDGHPSFLICPGHARDYFYTFGVPKRVGAAAGDPAPWDTNESASTMWYHDHANDVTAENALRGMSGFCLATDEVEAALQREHKLPAGPQDVPVVLGDRCLLKDGSLHFDPFDHNGYLGSLILCNGRAFARLKVKPWRYRFRFLNGSLARFYRLEFRDAADLVVPPSQDGRGAIPFDRIGKDTWLYPKPLPGQTSVFLGMAKRADLVVDFGRYKERGGTVYLVQTLEQRDGRGPGHGDNAVDAGAPRGDLEAKPLRAGGDALDPFPVVRLLKIEVEPSAEPDPCRDGYSSDLPLREHEDYAHLYHHVLTEPERRALPTRTFVFERRQGAWQVNHEFFEERRGDAIPSFRGPNGGLEKWVLVNKSGGWWHPIHIHLESHQYLREVTRTDRSGRVRWAAATPLPPGKPAWAEGELLRPEDRFKHDTAILGPNTTVELLMRFRTFEGPFVFHCHNLNHEDMRMMKNIDPRAGPARLTPDDIDAARWHGPPPDPHGDPCDPGGVA